MPTKDYMAAIRDRAKKDPVAKSYSDEALDALITIDSTTFTWRRRMSKRGLVAYVLDQLGLDLERTEFEALTAIVHMQGGIGTQKRSEITIGDVAEELNLDPSRASRLVTSLVSKGYLRRTASQEDGRKSVLAHTQASEALLRAFMTIKWRMIFKGFSGWSEEDLTHYAELFARHIDMWHTEIENADAAGDIAGQLSNDIAQALKDELDSRNQPA
ncbi:MAG: MarR family transcriptional regulator [Hyphomicrobiaceae bacterium]|nr:MarR family transcriptional regulator [Hyphomicrobiaceae bacterium]MCC0023328.1 MarR family transcriptional regulator [Hyphomicrobiaceae bacterium]